LQRNIACFLLPVCNSITGCTTTFSAHSACGSQVPPAKTQVQVGDSGFPAMNQRSIEPSTHKKWPEGG
jgi:hypothetical protein